MMKHSPKTKAVWHHSLYTSHNTISDEVSSIASISKANYNAPEQCPKFQTCNAPICPLDASWHKRINRSEDATCYYLIESVKDDAQVNFERGGLGDLYNRVAGNRAELSARYARLNYVIDRAAKTGSRMARSYLKR